MFQEDISQHKMPYNNRLERYPNFKATINGEDKIAARNILINLSENYRPHSNIESLENDYLDTNIICEVVNKASQSIYHSGNILIRKVVKPDAETVFIKIFPQNIVRFLNLYLQYIPAMERERFKSCIKFDNAADIYSLTLFDKIFSRVKFKAIGLLLALTDKTFPDFFLKDRLQNRFFDTNHYKLLEVQFMTLLTKKYAWRLRFSADEYTNEYARIHALYKSAILNSKDREILIEGLNKMLKHFNIDANISVIGIPTSKDLRESILQLERGEKSFGDALNEIYLR